MSNSTMRTTDPPGRVTWKRLVSMVALAFAGFVLFYVYVLLPTPIALRWWAPDRSAVMRERVAQARAAGADLELRHTWVDLDHISRNLQRAVIAAEDGHFWTHEGVDWTAIGEELRYRSDGEFSWTEARDREALWDALGYLRSHRRDVKGRSTITQQLAKNLYFSTDRSLLRKLEELVVARRIERFVDKDRILELYLNFAEFGPGLFGAEAAARAYFGVPASDLDLAQAASLAATLPHPLTSNPAHHPGRMAWRRDRILALLRGGAGARDAAPQPSVPIPELEELGEPIDVPAPEDLADTHVEPVGGGPPAADSAAPDSVGGGPPAADSAAPPADSAGVDPRPPPPGADGAADSTPDSTATVA